MEVKSRKTAKQYYNDPLLQNLLESVFKKYQGQNGVRGNAKIRVSSRAEAERLQDFFGNRLERMIRPNAEIQVPLKVISEELAYGYELEIPELFELLYDKPLLTKLEQRQLKERTWAELFEKVSMRFAHECKQSPYDGAFSNKIFNWFGRLKDGNAGGYGVLQSVVRKDGESEKVFFRCMKALWYLFSEKGNDYMLYKIGSSVPWIRLPIFANFATSDPHAFDWKEPAGRLLWYALNDIDTQKIKSGEKRANENLIVPEFMKRRQIYRNYGLMDDDISSNFHIFAPHFIYGASPRTINLSEMESYQDWPAYSALYILENPAVFSFLVDETLHFLDVNGLSYEQMPGDFPALVCTSGQPRNVAKFFISKCLNANPNCMVYYSGDFDLSGLQMQIAIEQQFLGRVQVWRMDSATYLEHVDPQCLPLSLRDKKILGEKTPGDLAKRMARIGAKVFQEQITKELKEDWMKVLDQFLKVA